MNRVVLIGFMGAGKTTIGEKLATALGAEFIDSDAEIVKREGKSIPDIFTTQGEEAFRQMETELLRELASGNEALVLSCGGGMPVRDINRTLLKKIGTVVYLKADKETIYGRVAGDTNRPLLKAEDLKARIHELFTAREDIYLDAKNVEVDASREVTEVLADILKALEG